MHCLLLHGLILKQKQKKQIRIHTDLPLKFDHVPRDPDTLAKLEKHFKFPHITRKLRADALLSLVTAAVMGSWIGKKTSVSLGKMFYPGKKIYGEHFSYAHIKGALKHVKDYNVLGMNIVKPGTHNVDQSTIWASDELLTLFEKDAFIPVAAPPVVLKDRNKKPIPLPETPETEAIVGRMARINTELRKLNVTFSSSRFKHDGNRVEVGNQQFIEGNISLQRIFTRGKFQCHGRLYGRHTSLKSGFRKRMLFNGEPVGEWDFSAIHPHMLFAEKGLQLDRDIYNLGGWDRNKVWKKVFNIGVNARTKGKAAGAISGKTSFPDEQCGLLVHLMKSMTHEIADKFHSDAGIHLQFRESEMILEIMETLFSEGIMNLSVHDSIIAPLSYEEKVIEVMENVFRKHNNGFSCKASRK